jgi:hypothetical protein
MDLFKGKSPSERNKVIAAIVLGVLAFAALAFAFGPGLFRSSSTSAKVSVDATGKQTSTTATQAAPGQFRMPSQDEQLFDYGTTPIAYRPGVYGAPAPGRNIFAFYEPPPPTPYSPTPVVVRTPIPTPTPTPFPYLIAQVMPQSVFAGQRAFKLEVVGEGFEPGTKIYFNQAQVPTTYLGPQRLTADIPANMIAAAGGKQIIVSSIDGVKYSEARTLQVQAPPTPQQQYEYVGMISRKFSNNDTAYFMEKTKLTTPGATPTGKRLNDILGGRFRLISISEKETLFEDVNLGFKHRMPILRTAPGGGSGSPSGFPSGFPNSGRPAGFPGFPNVTNPQVPQPRPGNTNRPRRDDDDDDDDTDN